jgi:hypothetical protein
LAETFCLRRQPHRPTTSLQEIIAEKVSAALKRRGRRRLREPDAIAGTADMTFVEQRVENDQEVEIDGA